MSLLGLPKTRNNVFHDFELDKMTDTEILYLIKQGAKVMVYSEDDTLITARLIDFLEREKPDFIERYKVFL